MRRSIGWGRRKKRKTARIKLTLFFIFSFFILLLTFTISEFDKNVMPAVLSTHDLQVKNRINIIINQAVSKIVEDNQISSPDFYNKTEGENGKILSLSVNTLLVNSLCNQAAVEISKELGALDDEKIEIPIGALSGVSFFANQGPKYAVSVKPTGNATVDYQTKFETSGINQTNFQVWLHVKSTVQIILPFQKNEIVVTRDVPLVNTVFTGEVPAAYLNMERPGTTVD